MYFEEELETVRQIFQTLRDYTTSMEKLECQTTYTDVKEAIAQLKNDTVKPMNDFHKRLKEAVKNINMDLEFTEVSDENRDHSATPDH